MEVIAKLKHLRMSPNKVRLVADLIRKLPVNEAIDQLTYSPKLAAKPLMRLLKSAVANAKHNFQLREEQLFVKAITVAMGTTLFRFMPRAHGRAYSVRKKCSHVEIILGTKEGLDKSKSIVTGDVPEAAKVKDKKEQKGETLRAEKNNKPANIEGGKNQEINPRVRGKHRWNQDRDRKSMKEPLADKEERAKKNIDLNS